MKILIIRKNADISLINPANCYALRRDQRIHTIEQLCDLGKEDVAASCGESVADQITKHLAGCCDCSFSVLLVDTEVLARWSLPEDEELRAANTLYRNITEAIGYTTETLQKDVLLYPDDEIITPEIVQSTPYFGQLVRASVLRLACRKFLAGYVGITADEIAAELKKTASRDVIDAAVETLILAKRIAWEGDLLIPLLPRMHDYFKEKYAPQSKCLYTIEQLLAGVSETRVSNELQISRQAVSQRTKAMLRKRPVFAEDRYRFIFEKYDIPQNLFCEITGESPEAYRYLAKAYAHGNIPIRRMLQDADDRTTVRLFREYLATHNTDVVLILPDGFYVSDQQTIFNYVLKQTTESITLPEFCIRQNEVVASLHLPPEKEKKMTVAVKTFSRSMCTSLLTIWSRKRLFRYYDMTARDFTDLYRYAIDFMLHSELFDRSTDSIFDSAPALMEQYDIRNSAELHNVFRKTIPLYQHVPGVEHLIILRMNHIDIDAEACRNNESRYFAALGSH